MLESEHVIRNDDHVNSDDNVYPNKIYADFHQLKQPKTLTEEQKELITHNANYLSKHIWYWDEKDTKYQFNLPKTIFSETSNRITIGEKYSTNNDIKYLNQNNGKGRSLSKEQLEHIWQRGEFCVESTIPNLPYKWKLSKFTVKGIVNNIKSFKYCFTFAFEMLYLIKYRFIGVFSFIFCSLCECISFILNTIIGIPLYYKYEHAIINEIKHNDLIKFITNNPNLKLMIYCHKIYAHLRYITTKFEKEVWPSIKKEIETKYYKEGLSSNEIDQRLYVLQKDEYYNYIYTQNEFVNLENKYKCLDLLKAQQIINNKEHEYTIEKERLLTEYELQLQKNSIRYESKRWKCNKIKAYDDEITKRLTAQKNKQIAKEIEDYTEASLIYNKNVTFNNNYQTLYEQAKALSKKQPYHSINIRRKCIRPYKVIKLENHLVKHTTFIVKSNYYGWRLFLYFMRFLIYTWNIAVCSLKNVFYSCVSIQALFRYTLYTDDTISYSNDEVIKTDQTYTYPRTLCNLIQWILSSRKHFEEQPDKGLFGKKFTRIFNLIWNYIIKLVIFGVIILISYPILIVISSIFFLLCFFTSPVLSLAFIILELLFEIVIYDAICNKLFPLIRQILWIGFLLLFFIGNVCLIILQPIVAVCSVIFGVIEFILRYIYDFIMYYLVKCLANVPEVDTCFAWKIEGPELFRNRFYNLADADILLLLRGQLEEDQLKYYYSKTMKQLEQPEQDLKNNIKALYEYLNLDIKRAPPFIGQSISFYKTKLSTLIKQRKDLFPKCDKNIQVRFTKSRLSYVNQLMKKYIIEFGKENGLEASVKMNNIKEYKDFYSRLVEVYLLKIFGSKIMETLEENDEIVYLESKSSKLIDVIDEIGKKLLNDPNYKSEVIIKEKNKEQKKSISKPNIATFKDVFTETSYLFLDMRLLNDDEIKQFVLKS